MTDSQTRAQAELERRRRRGRVVMYDPDDPETMQRPAGHKGQVIFLPENGRGDQTTD